MGDILICDTECFRNYWVAGFLRPTDGAILKLEKSATVQLDRPRLERLMLNNQIVTYNGLGYDRALIWAAIRGASCERLKQLNDAIINGGVKYWEVEDLLNDFFPGFGRIPRMDMIDLMEPQPNAFASLKTLQGRLHGRKMQDFPMEHDAVLSEDDMVVVRSYLDNDLDATRNVWEALKEPLELRVGLSKTYGLGDLRSKSDSQVGEAIVKARYEKETGERVKKAEVRPGTMFRYQIPPYIKFETPQLREILERLRTTDFIVKANGKVDLPKWLSETKVALGSQLYAMGIGGLHSTESKRSLFSTTTHVLIDADVASYYPQIILGSGLFPVAIGRLFLTIYRAIRDDRIAGKKAKDKTKDKGLKIAINGLFGKLLSMFSPVYAPHLGITVTLTGQLALLMLIERAVLAGIDVVSGNTDGVLFNCPRELVDGLAKDRLAGGLLEEITSQWERDTGFDLEFAEYRSIHNASVNTYFAIKSNGGHKRKGPLGRPWGDDPDDKDMRTQLMTNPSMAVCSDAALQFIKNGTPIEQTIRERKDIRDFVTVVKVEGGGTWRGDYLGKVVRYYWGQDGDPILYKKPDPRTGNFKRVSKTDGARPMMELPDELPDDLDYLAYVQSAKDILVDVGFTEAPPPPVKLPMRARAKLPWAMIAYALLD